MATAIDTSVLIFAERAGCLDPFLKGEPAAYVPALAAAEFILGLHLVGNAKIRQKGHEFYATEIKPKVVSFTESDAVQLALLNFQLRKAGHQMGFYDAAIASSALARGDELLAADSDYDRIEGLTVKNFPRNRAAGVQVDGGERAQRQIRRAQRSPGQVVHQADGVLALKPKANHPRSLVRFGFFQPIRALAAKDRLRAA